MLVFRGVICVSKVVSTHLWNTPLNLHEGLLKRDFFSELANGGIASGVLYGCVETTFECIHP